MNPYSQHKDAAWYFIQWATSPQVALQLAEHGIASPRKSTWASPAFKATLRGVRAAWADALTKTLADGDPNVGPPVVQQSEVRQQIGLAVDAVILGQASAQKAADAAEAKAQAIVSQSAK
jgi:multiple sugar transport system substrate-binding protein